MEVTDDDLVLEDVHHADVVPDALDGDLLAADLHTDDGRRAARIFQDIVRHQGADVVVVAIEPLNQAGRAADIGPVHVGERVGVDAHDRAQVLAEVVVDDDRLSTPDEYCCRGVGAPARAVGTGQAGEVVLDPRVGESEIALVHLNHVEEVARTLDWR